MEYGVGASVEMTLSEFFLNPLLAFQKPIERLVKFILTRVGHAHFLGHCCRVREAGLGEFRARVDQALGDHRHHQIALTARTRGDDRIETQKTNRPQHRILSFIDQYFQIRSPRSDTSKGSSFETNIFSSFVNPTASTFAFHTAFLIPKRLDVCAHHADWDIEIIH